LLNLLRNCCAVLFIAFAAAAVAEESSTRTYQLPDQGALQLTVPKSWHEEIKQPPGGVPPTITFTPASGAAFNIQITPMYPPRPGVPMPDLKWLRGNVERAAADAAPQAVEKNIAINELHGPSANGYYFSATDKAPAPGEYKYMTQAELRVGDVAPVVTVLTNDASGQVLADALAVLKSAVHLKR